MVSQSGRHRNRGVFQTSELTKSKSELQRSNCALKSFRFSCNLPPEAVLQLLTFSDVCEYDDVANSYIQKRYKEPSHYTAFGAFSCANILLHDLQRQIVHIQYTHTRRILFFLSSHKLDQNEALEIDDTPEQLVAVNRRSKARCIT